MEDREEEASAEDLAEGALEAEAVASVAAASAEGTDPEDFITDPRTIIFTDRFSVFTGQSSDMDTEAAALAE